MNGSLLKVVHSDPDLLVVDKPAGLVCHPTKTDEYSSLIGRARLYFGPGAGPRMINRLDRETSGLVLIARTSNAARELGKIWESRLVIKTYLAIVHGHIGDKPVTIDAPLGKDIQSPVAVKDCVRADGLPSRTEIYPLKNWLRRTSAGEQAFSLVKVNPLSGRKHQIRIHLQHHGNPIVGDKLYGHDERCYLRLVEGEQTELDRERLILPWQALAATGVQFEWRGEVWKFETEPELWFRDFAGPWPASAEPLAGP